MTVTFTTCVVKEIANILDIFLLEAFYSFGFAKHILCMPSNSMGVVFTKVAYEMAFLELVIQG